MPDVSWATSPAVRRSMQSNRSRDTRPELALRRELHRRGLRYRVCARPLPHLRRTADIVFRPARVAVALHGCYWHGCAEHHRLPAKNRDYWSAKIARNVARDAGVAQALEEAGWLLIVVWEHDDPLRAADEVEAAVRARSGRATGDPT